ncbi:MAG TPA: hypothetical protein VM737_07820 [Gemmatimonadota bacterium]|nr:hypothetical protein [Gemmatimonadota bacterium]
MRFPKLFPGLFPALTIAATLVLGACADDGIDEGDTELTPADTALMIPPPASDMDDMMMDDTMMMGDTM